MRIAILIFPGSNCERETMLAVERAGMTAVEVLWNEPLDKLATYDGYILVGGFSYEDRGRAGVIAAHQPLMQVLKEQSQQGKPILGICNGAQILVESGLVPGYPLQAALTDNKRIHQGQVVGTGYYNAWVYLKPNLHQTRQAFTRHLTPGSVLKIPIAHAEGRFLIPEASRDMIEDKGLASFQYCTETGEVVNEFPTNPNGSIDNIAALSNEAGNVMAIMPHPERTSHGDVLFLSMRDYIASGYKATTHANASLSTHHASIKPQPYVQAPNTHELIVSLIIADNHALSLQDTLARHLGCAVRLKRHIHWSIACDSLTTLEHVKASGVLYNDKKEYVVNKARLPSTATFLVTAKDDLIGQQKQQLLQHHFAIDGLSTLKRSVLWQIEMDEVPTEATVETILHSTLLFNPLSHECYHYV